MSHDPHTLKEQFFQSLYSEPDLFDWIEANATDGLTFGRLAKSRLSWHSLAFCQALGYDAAGNGAIALHPEDESLLRELLAQQQTEAILRFRHGDGSLRAFGSKCRLIADAQGEWTHYLLAHAQICDPGPPHASLEAMVDAYPLFFRHILDAVGQSVIALDTDHNVQFWNRGAENIFGWRADEVMGKPLRSRLVAAEAHSHADQILDDLAQGHDWNGEFWLKRKNGELFPALVGNRILHHPNGAVMGYVGVSTDISDLHQTQAALQISKQSLELAARTAGLGIWQLELATGRLEWNEELFSIYEIGQEEFAQNTEAWQALVYEEDREKANQEFNRILEGESVDNVRFRIKTRSGKVKHILASGAPLRAKDGRIVKLIGINIDITRLIDLEHTEEMARQLANQNRELSQFARLASHDLQEPLRTIHSYTQLLQRRYLDQMDASAQPILTFLAEASEHLMALVRALINYYRLGGGRQASVVDTAALVSEVLAALEVQVKQHEAQFEIGFLPKVSGYEVELRQLFQNLISNAIKFRDPAKKPYIRIHAEPTERGYRFSVADNGIGIPKAYQEKIFQIFQRLHNQEQYQGQGIGLAFCKKIVDLHYGELWVDSQLGEGSTFYFFLTRDLT